MQVYRFTLIIEDEIKAESASEAWNIAKDRVEDRYYGPTMVNIEFLREEEEEVEE